MGHDTTFIADSILWKNAKADVTIQVMTMSYLEIRARDKIKEIVTDDELGHSQQDA